MSIFMEKNDFWAKLSGLSFFYRWHPEVALRYLPIVSEIKKYPGTPKILEVGSGGLGIAPYLKKPVTGLDLEFEPPYHPMLHKVKGSVLKLPFADGSYDIVLAADMLEHLPKSKRQKAVSEMLRVARDKLFIAVPCGKEAFRQDEELDSEYQEKYHRRYHFLEEHLEGKIDKGLPEEKEIYDTILSQAVSLKKKIEIKTFDNENLQLRKFLMRGWMSNNIFVNIFFRKILLLALPLLRRMNKKPVYRQIFVCQLI